MGWKYRCNECGNNNSDNIKWLFKDEYECLKCGSHNVSEIYIPHPAERRRAMVYATGNKWAIENWNATH